jgi:hypothetical protein
MSFITVLHGIRQCWFPRCSQVLRCPPTHVGGKVWAGLWSRFLGQNPQTYRDGGLAWTLNHRPRPYQSSLTWFHNNLQDRGDCQNTRKSYKTSHVVGWKFAGKRTRTPLYSGRVLPEVFTRVGPDDSLERLTESSVGLVTNRPSNINQLFVTLFE